MYASVGKVAAMQQRQSGRNNSQMDVEVELALGRRFKGLEVMPLFHICSICHTFLIKNL